MGKQQKMKSKLPSVAFDIDIAPCVICGATTNAHGKPLNNYHSQAMHRNWHIRKGEARISATGDLVPTAEGKRKFAEYLSQNSSEVTPVTEETAIVTQEIPATTATLQPAQAAQVAQSNTTVINLPSVDASADILKTLTNSLLLVQFASVIHGMPPEQAMQVVATVKQMGNMRRKT